MSNKKKIDFMRSYFEEIKTTNNKNNWLECFICRQPKAGYITLENIIIPVCENHLGI